MGALTGCCREGRSKDEEDMDPNNNKTPFEKKKLLSSQEISNAVDLLFSPEIYEKLLKGENKEKLSQPLQCFDNTSLFSIIIQVYDMLEKHNNSDEKVTNFKSTVLFGIKSLIEAIKVNKQNLSKEDDNQDIQKCFINTICKLSELYHYLKYISSNGLSPYNKNLWIKEDNIDTYMKTQVFECTNHLTKVKNVITKNNSGNLISTNKEENVEQKQKFAADYLDGMFTSNAK